MSFKPAKEHAVTTSVANNGRERCDGRGPISERTGAPIALICGDAPDHFRTTTKPPPSDVVRASLLLSPRRMRTRLAGRLALPLNSHFSRPREKCANLPRQPPAPAMRAPPSGHV